MIARAALQVVCEHVRPLAAENLADYSGDEICLGLFNVATALSFLHNKVDGAPYLNAESLPSLPHRPTTRTRLR